MIGLDFKWIGFWMDWILDDWILDDFRMRQLIANK